MNTLESGTKGSTESTNAFWKWLLSKIQVTSAFWKKLQSKIPQLSILAFVIMILLIVVSLFLIIYHGLIGLPTFGMQRYSIESVTIDILFVTLCTMFIILPTLMIFTYDQLKTEEILNKINHDLLLCGLGKQGMKNDLDTRLEILKRKSGFKAYITPTFILTILLFLFWVIVIIPKGYHGVFNAFTQIDEFDLSRVFQYFLFESSPVTWSFLGAYIYILQSLMRRWTRSDLTSGFLWRLDLRLIIAFIVGWLLIMATTPENNLLNIDNTKIWLIAFFGGFIPDAIISWLISRAKSMLNVEGANSFKDWWKGIFQPSDLQQSIEGLNFWQADRLFEEGIESVRNLAMKEIPNLLIETRFDTPCLIDWVDQALLCSQVGDTLPMECFRKIGIKTASDLLSICDSRDISQEALVKSLLATDDVLKKEVKSLPDIDQEKAVLGIVKNIVEGVRVGANIEYIKEYWNNSTPEKRSEVLNTNDKKRNSRRPTSRKMIQNDVVSG